MTSRLWPDPMCDVEGTYLGIDDLAIATCPDCRAEGRSISASTCPIREMRRVLSEYVCPAHAIVREYEMAEHFKEE